MKFGLMTGAAIACAVMTGCKATKPQTSGGTTMEPTRPARQTVVVTADERPAQKAAKPAPFKKAPEAARCTCAPGTVHAVPCACGAPDCACRVKAPEPEYTVYRVKNGDMLSAICKTYGLKQKKVLELNPGLDPNRLYAGRKIKLPGKIELKGDDAKSAPKAAAPAVAAAKLPAAKRASKVSSYKGATKEYVVKNGDSLGKIAYANGVTIKCLKEMNGLKTNNIRIGQKLKVPAEKPAAAEPEAAAKQQPAAAPVKAAAPAEAVNAEKTVAAEPAPAAPAAESAVATPEEKKPAEAAPAVEQVQETTAALEAGEVKTHTVKEGEDMVSIAIMYNVSPSAIMDLNDLKNTDTLTVGQVLKLPANAKMQ